MGLADNLFTFQWSGMLVDMRALDQFETMEDRAVFRPAGQISVAQAVQLVTDGVAFARSLDVRKLLVDITNLVGFEPPGMVLRYFIIHEWTRAAGRLVKVAIVTRPEMFDSEVANPRKIGVAVATEIGFTADIFTTEGDALRWLERLN